MKILVALMPQALRVSSIDAVLTGEAAVSGSVSATIRAANLLHEAGHEVTLSSAGKVTSEKIPAHVHEEVDPSAFDRFIVNHNHWIQPQYTFPRETLDRTFLWMQNHLYPADLYRFFQAGGRHAVCLSKSHAGAYRQLPQWKERVSVIPNTYSPLFEPVPEDAAPPGDTGKRKLLFIGALTRSKGFVELTRIWTHLARNGADLQLEIAGSQKVHEANVALGPSGLVDARLEEEVLTPWLQDLPETHQPVFLGAIGAAELRKKIHESWAAIVNPGLAGETFCVGAAEAQACNRSVFSIRYEALEETIYTGRFNTLGVPGQPETVAERILEGLQNPEAVRQNGMEAGDHVRKHFGLKTIQQSWVNLLETDHPQTTPLHHTLTTKDKIRNALRVSGLGVPALNLISAENRRIMKAVREGRNPWA